MGLPNSGLFLSEKDLGVMEFDFLSRHALEFQDHGCQIGELEQEQEQELEQQKEKCDIIEVSSLELIKRPSLGAFMEDNDDGFKTPTSLDQGIPLIPRCPPAPRKLKSLPSTKRRSMACRRRILLDLSTYEIESLFPDPVLLPDLGGKIKKARKLDGTT